MLNLVIEKRKRWPTYSLRSLVLLVILIATSLGLWWRWDVWVLEGRIKGHSSMILSADFSLDSRRIVSASEDRTVKIWESNNGDELMNFQQHGDGVYAAKFSPDGRLVVSLGYDKYLRIFNANTGKEVLALKLLSKGIYMSANFSPDGRKIIACDGLTVRTLDPSTGKELKSLIGHSDTVYAATFSPDGRTIATTSADQTAKVWDSETGLELMTFDLMDHVTITPVLFSPDSNRIAIWSGDASARIWDLTKGEETSKLTGHQIPIYSGMFSQDGKRLFTHSWDGTKREWNSESGKELSSEKNPPGMVIGEYGGCTFALEETNEILIWRKRRPGYWWGVLWLWESWSVIIVAAAFGLSLWHSQRNLSSCVKSDL